MLIRVSETFRTFPDPPESDSETSSACLAPALEPVNFVPTAEIMYNFFINYF